MLEVLEFSNPNHTCTFPQFYKNDCRYSILFTSCKIHCFIYLEYFSFSDASTCEQKRYKTEKKKKLSSPQELDNLILSKRRCLKYIFLHLFLYGQET